MRIRQLGDPILRTISDAVEANSISDDKHQQIINKMKTVLDGIKAISHENGNAISAPQVGVAKRIVLLRLNDEFVPMINPEFIEKSDQMFEFEEECFSFYSLRGVVSRHQKVIVRYLDETGQQQQMELEGEESGLVQHEIDHLDGVFFADRVEQSQTLRTVDYDLREKPERLNQVREMIHYMVGVE